MALIEVNWKPSDKQLRSFGWVAVAATATIATLLYLIKGLAIQWCAVIVAVGAVCLVCSLISLRLTRWVYLGLTTITFPIGMVMSFVLMTLFYYLLLTPIGLIFRLIGRDVLCRKFDPDAKSYWVEHRPADELKRYFNQF